MRIALALLPMMALLFGCAPDSTNAGPPAAAPADGLPLVASPMTVDEVLSALRGGKTIEDLYPRLGIPFISMLRTHYVLADGSITAERDFLRLRKNGAREEIVIPRPE